ncbi:TPA: hypothetical protein SFZ43_000158 [Campylobacter jejuni]|nr:hypothetical protein [Campylobacter jejuni]
MSKIFLVQPGKKFSDTPKIDEDEDIGNKKSKSLSSKRLSSLKSMEISTTDTVVNGETHGLKSKTQPTETKSMDLETFKALHQKNNAVSKNDREKRDKTRRTDTLTSEDIDGYIDEIVKEEPNLPYLPKSVYTLLLRVRHVYNKNLYSPEEWSVYRETIKNNILNSYKRGRK